MWGWIRRKKNADRQSLSKSEEEICSAAGIAHATFLNVIGRELDDTEFAAAALGAVDGVIQSRGLKKNHTEMLSIGTIFALRQMNDLERMPHATSEKKGSVIGEAMSSNDLEEIRMRAGQIAYSFG